MSKLFETQYIETPLIQYWGGSDKVMSPWIWMFIIAGLIVGMVLLK